MNITYVIDGNSLLFRSFYAMYRPGTQVLTSASGVPINAIYSFRNMMKKLKGQLTEDDRMIVCFDTGRETFRAKEFLKYKKNRKPIDPLLKEQLPISRELLDAMNIPHCELEGYEGDDLAGSLAKYAARKGDKVYVFTSDKDFLQLLEENITVEFLRKGLSDIQVFTPDNMYEQLGYRHDQVIDYKGLVGDPSDNIPGIRGVGHKTATKLLDQFGHLEGIFEGIKDSKTKTNLNILENKEDALFCRHIATILTDIDVSEIYEKGKVQPYDFEKLLAFYQKYNLNKFARELTKAHQQQIALNFEDDKNESFNNNAKPNYPGFEEIDSFEGSDFHPDSIIAYNSDSNFHKGKMLGFFLSDGNKVKFISIDSALKDEAFLKLLSSDKIKKTYDLKGLIVSLNKLKLVGAQAITFDLKISTYLLDANVGQTKEECMEYYLQDITEYSEPEKLAYICFFTSQNSEEVISRLKDNDEYELYSDLELPLTKVLAQMEIEGFPLERSSLEEINREYQERLDSIKRSIFEIIGEEINLNSPKQVSQLIYDKLKLKKRGKTNSTSISVLNAIADRHPVIPLIIQYRKYSKIVSGYTDALGKYIYEDGKIHAIFNQALTATGRLSMSEPNLQNISMRDEDGKQIRKAFFYKDKKYKFLSLDYSQIELRVLASVADSKELIEVFNNNVDIHTATASKIFGVSPSQVTPSMRSKAKTVNFGIVYGVSPWGLSEQIRVSPTEAGQIIESFYSSYPGLREFEKETIASAHRNGYVKTILNRRRYLENIDSSNHNIRAFNERAAVNSVIQGSAADLIKVAMIQIDEMLKKYKTKMVLQIHDELIFKVPEDEESFIKEKVRKIMENCLKLKCSLKVEGSFGYTWFDCK
ncbi:MAG: DNA polymerase I [Bacilli bacterium]